MGSRSIKVVLATVGVLTLASVGQAVPAGAALTPVVYGFGSNQAGELGNGTTTASLSPTPVTGLPGTVRQLATGLQSAAAVMSDGSLWTWGSNYYHQLGYSSSASIVSTPRQVPGLSGVTQVALSGEGNGYAVESDGSVWAWGDNSHAQLGNGTTTPSYSPVRLPILTGITQVAAGAYYALALRSDGTVWSWGDNGNGALGDGTTYNESLPEPVPHLTGITQVASGGLESFAVRSDGTLFSWGNNGSGELGNGTSGGFSATPAAVPGLTGVTQVASDGWATMAVAGTIMRAWAWGDNTCGELGDGTTTSKLSPEPIGLVGVTQVVMGQNFLLQTYSAAIRYDGTLWTWGCNPFGQLGYGAVTGAIHTPTQVTSLAGVSQFAFGDDSSGIFHPGADGLVVGSLPATVPDLHGDSISQAGQALNAAGLVFGSVTYVVDYTCTNIGTVTWQSPAAGARVNRGAAVSIRIGTAPRPPRECL